MFMPKVKSGRIGWSLWRVVRCARCWSFKNAADRRRAAFEAQVRLCARSRRLQAAGKHANVVMAATVREMLGFAWAIAREVAPHTSA